MDGVESRLPVLFGASNAETATIVEVCINVHSLHDEREREIRNLERPKGWKSSVEGGLGRRCARDSAPSVRRDSEAKTSVIAPGSFKLRVQIENAEPERLAWAWSSSPLSVC